jgi:hypothetical protein
MLGAMNITPVYKLVVCICSEAKDLEMCSGGMDTIQ